MNPNDHTEMYTDGYEAALAGDPMSSPYRLKKSVDSWMRGYRAGLKERNRRKNEIVLHKEQKHLEAGAR